MVPLFASVFKFRQEAFHPLQTELHKSLQILNMFFLLFQQVSSLSLFLQVKSLILCNVPSQKNIPGSQTYFILSKVILVHAANCHQL